MRLVQRIEHSGLELLFKVLIDREYRIIGPTLKDHAIVFDEIRSVSDLPRGWTDVQEAGTYRLRRRNDNAVFGYSVGPHSWKNMLFPARERLWTAKRSDEGFEVIPEHSDKVKKAFLGVRSCDLHAIEIQDKIFLKGRFQDQSYEEHRKDNLIIAVHCTQAGGTCFCASMGTGPRVKDRYDISLTEIIDEREHYFLIESGSAVGEELLTLLPARDVAVQELQEADRRIDQCAESMGRVLDTTGIKELLYRNFEHPRWDEVANRCLSCANCTLVCPTCFCSTFEDVTDLTGHHTERWRRWDSCFNLDHSYIHGGSVRSSVKSRYRQWMTHKLASWIDQFGESGCVGCGRCITWCPVGIDITEETAAIRATEKRGAS